MLIIQLLIILYNQNNDYIKTKQNNKYLTFFSNINNIIINLFIHVVGIIS